MASSFSYIFVPFFTLFVFPNLSCSCPWSPPPCGPVKINFPFMRADSNPSLPPTCGIHVISCDKYSTPIVHFYGRQDLSYIVKQINYTDGSIIIEDQESSNPDCIFLYKFDPPIPLSNSTSFLPQLANQKQPLFNCEPNGYDICTDIFHKMIDNRSLCRGYDLFFSKKPEGEGSDQHECWASPSQSFEWKLQFNNMTGGLHLEFASNSLLLPAIDSGCFKQNITGNSTCPGDHECRGNSDSGRKTEAGKSDPRRKIAVGVGAGVGGFIAAGLLCLLWYNYRNRKQRLTSAVPLGPTASSGPSSYRDPEFGSSQYLTSIFSYEELEEATNGFHASRELGGGGFGTVYQGKLRDGRVVAVKRLYRHNWNRVEQFMNEVEILSRLRHPNLVSLYGCTSRHSRELLLVYEYVLNGTVADNLHGPRAHDRALTWPIRMSIAIETADALTYLHAVEPQIIHRDVKTSNILLDSSFHVKVADFGLSRLFPLNASHVSTGPQGTPGYVDPFYHQCYQLTDKSDVYSFGVVLIELISSKPAVDTSRSRQDINLANMAISKIQNCQLEQLVDPCLGYQSDWEMKTMITLVAELAFRCLQLDREIRPSIKEVHEVLRKIASGEYKTEKVEGADVTVREDASLLRSILSFSPDSVTGRWESRSTTPHTSE